MYSICYWYKLLLYKRIQFSPIGWNLSWFKYLINSSNASFSGHYDFGPLIGPGDIIWSGCQDFGKYCGTFNVQMSHHAEILRPWFAVMRSFYPTYNSTHQLLRFELNIREVIFKLIFVIDWSIGWSISYEYALRQVSVDLSNDNSTLVQVMAWCYQATSHYLSQCWPSSLSPYGITRPHWVNYVF